MIPRIDVIDTMCDALKLNNQTLFADQEGEYNFATGDTNKFFSVNPLLAKYIKIKHGDQEIPLDELSLEINTEYYAA